ncbi:NAD dependent epimerase/dehydratase family protein [Metarhizium album ARSEF 1941]|uniref:NAD dependent epimerase/dehydratase family protein n=1 Tax=Metarhizium album (strain ARSEF 1941) TaxID=1081103 RepID=A0A0B2WY30_METAS|nr:NAD dependent epimerase/dehydratase family protein [Metarhizium album ARSEF 1941]KHN98963.1 NAD dependent epimerase/dehydratase family protein [Metarhizium album ARSEF 1941]
MAASHHVLLIGGHGKVAQLLTPLLLKRSWTVTSMIRTDEQAPAIEKLGSGLPGKLNVLVRSVAEVSTQERAATILNDVKPDYVAWSADRDAAVNFVRAAADIPSIERFLLVSYAGSRRAGAPWWPQGEWDDYNESVNHGSLATYYKAKIAADEVLYETSKKSSTLVGICLRPATLTDEPAGKVELGKTAHVKGHASRASVAAVADALLAVDAVKNAWLDLQDGTEDVDAAVKRCVEDGVDAAEGEEIFGSKM